MCGASISADFDGLETTIQSGVPFHGASSCLGVMTNQGPFVDGGVGAGVLAISDPTGAYGSAVVPIEADEVEAAARAALQSALRQAGRPGETPELIWLSATPGVEERVIASIQEAIGTGVPICGGSAADNSVSGDWVVFDRSARFGSGIAISVMFPSVRVGYAFHSGYRPTSTQGRVTGANDRCIVSIDDQPGAQVYNDWTNGKIDDVLETGGSVIANTSLSLLGRRRDAVAGFDYFLLSHPASVSPDGGLGLFSDIEVGDEIVLMEGSEDNLVTRAPRVAENALEMARLDKDHISGALVIYCAGCMLTVQDRMTEVAAGLSDTLGGKPFLGTFTFGEQGCFIGGSNHHGNLMISVVVFGV
ncbi:MAG: FIST signal transduction protein [Alphaproteobacteria bacterium]